MNQITKNQIIALGDEAVGRAAVDAGVSGIFGYPGTPSTEVFEAAAHFIKKLDKRVSHWAANEKAAYELSLGASYNGKRSIVTMKHVGLNVAMDAFVNSAITGIQGGLVVLVADDPSMHSSQNEQDSRYLADFAGIPCLDPATPQEAYDFTYKAFELSEKLKLPVMVRLVTRLAHTRGIVNRSEVIEPVDLGIPVGEDRSNWVLIPANARVQYQKLRDNFPLLLKQADEFNRYFKNSSDIGIVSCGMGKGYFDQLMLENSESQNYTRLEVNAYPVNIELLKNIVKDCKKIYVFEENYPYLEDQLINLSNGSIQVNGRRNNTLSIAGELNPLKIRSALGVTLPELKAKADIEIPPRPPKLCDGCGHIDSFKAIKEALKEIGVKDPRIFGDIGCYTLGVQPPFNSIDTCVEMGASVGMTVGAALTGMGPAVGVIGDSTFFHSGLPTLLSLVRSDSNANLVIMDNRITGMTGQQEVVAMDIIPDVIKASGLKDEDLHQLIPLPKKHEENVAVLKEVFKKDGPSVIIFKRDCIQAMRKGIYKKIEEKRNLK